MRYAQKRWYSWSANIAYCVGLIASDGCLSKDERHIDLTSVDIEQLKNFCQAFGKNIKIASKMNKSVVPAYHVQFSDVAFYDFLIKAGLTPAKSHTLAEVYVPDEYYFDFLRGVFDGDGCIRGYMDTRWPNSLMFYIEIASASMVFLKFLQETNTRLANTTRGAINPCKGATKLSYAKQDSIKLAQVMYYQKNLPALTRKRIKLFDFIKVHEAAIIARNARVAESVDAPR
ncbi:MAG TPA: hypothetical protein VK978_00945 [Candidatus Saccharimonadales bacterium]|nr:hypothetical protein [Candidatus Saccharimonadales bacterium]